LRSRGRARLVDGSATANEQNHQDAGKLLILVALARAAILVATAQAARNYW
jgi:hypothetical protein